MIFIVKTIADSDFLKRQSYQIEQNTLQHISTWSSRWWVCFDYGKEIVGLNMDWTFHFSCCKNTTALIESNQIITCIVPNHKSYRRALNLLSRLRPVAPVVPTDSKHWGDSGKEKPREDPYSQIKLGNPSTRTRKRKQSLVVNGFLIWDLIGDTNYSNTLEFLIFFFDQSWKEKKKKKTDSAGSLCHWSKQMDNKCD